jgi:hypothetical protein
VEGPEQQRIVELKKMGEEVMVLEKRSQQDCSGAHYWEVPQEVMRLMRGQ